MPDGNKLHVLRPDRAAADMAVPGKTEHALGARLRELRRERNWTLEDAADRCGVARSTLSKIENDQMSPTFDLLTRLTAGFDLNITELFVARPPDQGAARRAVSAPARVASSRHRLTSTNSCARTSCASRC